MRLSLIKKALLISSVLCFYQFSVNAQENAAASTNAQETVSMEVSDPNISYTKTSVSPNTKDSIKPTVQDDSYQDPSLFEDTEIVAKPQKKFGIAGTPTISYNRSRGTAFGGLGMAFLKLGEKETTPLSRFVLMSRWYTNETWFASGFAQLFLKEDALRVSAGGGYGSSHFQAPIDIPELGLEDFSSPFVNKGVFFFSSVLFRVYDNLYVGPGVTLFRTDVEQELPGDLTNKFKEYSNALAASVRYDTKNDQYTPSGGITSIFRLMHSPEWFGNEIAYDKMLISTNYYHSIDKNLVLASRVAMDIGLGGVPFTAQSYVGNKDIRGYTKGEHRANQIYSAQSELRWGFAPRFGAVGFFGVAMTVDPKSQLLPGGGAGLRYKILPAQNINIGIDAAAGKDDWGVYFRMTEAF